MPEGDTVWRTARRLDRVLSGRALTGSDFRVPRLATADLTGQTVRETVSRGKHILTRLDEVTLHTHLKMEGSWHVYRPGTRWRAAGHKARVVLTNAEWTAVGFQLGIVELVDAGDEDSVVGHLGPDLLGADWSIEEAVRRLTRHPDAPIGEALIDQRNLAGLGTVYRSEACFLGGVHPETLVGEVVDLPRLVDRAQRVLAANRERASTTTGDTRKGQQLWVYRRAGQPCRRCGTRIRSGLLGTATDRAREAGAMSAVDNPDRSRVSYWCPTCQPAPAALGPQS
jgi:endonuclease-8